MTDEPVDADPIDIAVTKRSRAPLWLWVIALVISLVALAVSVEQVTRDRPTLRAMTADESMSDQDARTIADNTVRVWGREKNAKHLLNVRALSCPVPPPGLLANEIAALEKHAPITDLQFIVVDTTNFHREGPWWTMNVITAVNGFRFTLNIVDGELRVCQIDSAPTP